MIYTAPVVGSVLTSHSLSILKSYSPRFPKFGNKTTSDWLNRSVYQTRNCVTFKYRKLSEIKTKKVHWLVNTNSDVLARAIRHAHGLSLERCSDPCKDRTNEL